MSLDIKDLTFSYVNLPMCRREAKEVKTVLSSFNASFETGRITALTGDNGSGKTTLARLIMGIQKAEGTGHFILDGEEIDGWTLAERGRKIGYVMQNPAKQIFNDTVLKEVMYGLSNQGISGAEEIARGYIDMFGLADHIDDFPFDLSFGEKQRLVLASVIAMKPSYLILDEPTASLDQKHRRLLGELLLRIAKPETDCAGCGVIVITHDRNFIGNYCDMEVKIHE